MAILEVKDLKKSFGDAEVLKGISFSLEEKNVLAIIGSSGSGKTTLLRCINMLETADSGSITVDGGVVFDGSNTDKLSAQQQRENQLKIGLVFQSFNLVTRTTVIKNVLSACVPDMPFWRVLLGAFRKADKIKALESLDKVGILDKAYIRADQLSGGQQQRVAIARALALHPDILCFDEPTSALDPELTGEVLKVIRGLAEQKTTMIIVTHELAFARDVADQVIFMDGGFVVEQGDPKQVIDHPQEERTKQFLARFAENN